MTGLAAELLALLFQFEQSQWWSADNLRSFQFRQISNLVAHAARNVPYYRDRFREAGLDPRRPLTPQIWSRLPILTRRDVQRHEADLRARSYPQDHGPTAVAASGGSTAQPVRVSKTGIDAIFWNANQVRAELWNRDKRDGHVARLRGARMAGLSEAQQAKMLDPEGLRLPDWGPPCSLLWQTGPITLIHSYRPAAEQVETLRRIRPDYIQTQPSNLRLLIGHCRAAGIRIPSLRSVWTLSEVVDEGLRAACREVLGVPIIDDYTAGEVGYIALQCPQSEHYHTMAETTLVEVVDAAGRPCQPGETGRVVVTPLHNFAMPLLRYELGDEATVGGPCPCGRGLPVLRAIVGRTSDLLTLPDGRKRRTDLQHVQLSHISAITEYQIIQRDLDRIELLLVLNRAMTAAEHAKVRDLGLAEFGSDVRFDVTIVDSIERSPSGKLRTFISLIDTSL